jgi:hypothetical protein
LLEAFASSDADAVAGTVLNPPPSTLSEKAYFGRSRIGRRAVQNRLLVGCNMGFRRDVLEQYWFDEAMTLYCDEDDLALRMSRGGRAFRFVPEAVVVHRHPITIGRYLRMAVNQGVGAARLFSKHDRLVGRDIVGMTLATVSAPLVAVNGWFATLTAAGVALQVAANVFNQRVLQDKSWSVVCEVLPLELAYSAAKTGSFLAARLRIALGGDRGLRRSARQWRDRCRRREAG